MPRLEVLREPTHGELIEIATGLGIQVNKQADFAEFVQKLSIRLFTLREQGISPQEGGVMCGRPRFCKDLFELTLIVLGCGHVSGLYARYV
ncbi:hypothetical protein [Falsihalocynthiibacter arcticus]|uniref:hypothetical protein n=1 Tax=Falsihalocynthiibacter arcticus TaxID=1579316 RepID=UPI003001F359